MIHALQRKPPRESSPIIFDVYEELRRIRANMDQLRRRVYRDPVAKAELIEKLEPFRLELAAIVVLLSSRTERTKGDE